jgi:hypothetical protein
MCLTAMETGDEKRGAAAANTNEGIYLRCEETRAQRHERVRPMFSSNKPRANLCGVGADPRGRGRRRPGAEVLRSGRRRPTGGGAEAEGEDPGTAAQEARRRLRLRLRRSKLGPHRLNFFSPSLPPLHRSGVGVSPTKGRSCKPKQSKDDGRDSFIIGTTVGRPEFSWLRP